MANIINNELATLLNTGSIDTRLYSFIWFSLTQSDPALRQTNFDTLPQRNLVEFLSRDPGMIDNLRIAINNGFFDEIYLNWISESNRQAKWLEKYIAESGMGATVLNRHAIPHQLYGKRLSIALIDYWLVPVNLVNRSFTANSLRQAWQSHTQTDEVFDWLAGEESEAKRNSFQKWMIRHRPIGILSNPDFQTHEDLLQFFDQSVPIYSDRILFSKKARSAWNQELRRARSDDKKQCNFVLNEKTIFKLEKLAAMFGFSRTRILEIIISEEFDKKTHINEFIKYLERADQKINL